MPAHSPRSGSDTDQTSRRATVSLSGRRIQGRWCCRTAAAPAVAVVPTAATAARNRYWVTVAKIWSGTPTATPSATARQLAAAVSLDRPVQRRADRPDDQQADQDQVRAAGRVAGLADLRPTTRICP